MCGLLPRPPPTNQAIGFTSKNHSYPGSSLPSSTGRDLAALPWDSFLSHASGVTMSQGQEPRQGSGEESGKRRVERDVNVVTWYH